MMPHRRRIIYPVCHLCNEPVEINTAKTDADGKAIHEDCYIKSLNSPPKSSARIPNLKAFEPKSLLE
jgi:hypothetical protein